MCSTTHTPGVALYRILSVKSGPGGRWFVVVDGGMSDNPLAALARYNVTLANRHPLTRTEYDRRRPPLRVWRRTCARRATPDRRPFR
jgi:diaminopimelate decarboxylase